VLCTANFRIAERTLAFDLKMPWKIAEKYNAEARSAEATPSKIAESETWRCFLDEVRTFFEQNPQADFE